MLKKRCGPDCSRQQRNSPFAKVGMPFVAEAMEVLGGIGYCEESELPRLYREMPVNSIWEGSGNIMCLDVLRY